MSEGNGVAPVTARGVIRGEPAALAGVSSARGRAVLAYCEKVCGRGSSLGAAVEAFARFRATAFHAPDPLALNPDELLLSSTRRAAAGCVAVPQRHRTALCPDIPMLLAEHACGTLSARDRDRLTRHLSRCADCRDLELAQQAGERAYRDPGDRPLTEHEHAVIFASLATAVPSDVLRARGGDTDETALPMDSVTALAVPIEEDGTAHEPVTAPEPDRDRVDVAPHPEPVITVEPPADEPEEAVEVTPPTPPRLAAGATTRRSGTRARRSSARPRAVSRDWTGLATRFLAPTAVVVIAVLAALALAGVFGGGGGGHSNVASPPPTHAAMVVLPATPPTPLTPHS